MRRCVRIVCSGWVLATAGVYLALDRPARCSPAVDTRQWVRQSDFVGFVGVEPMVTDPAGHWRQAVLPYAVRPLKGRLKPAPAMNNQLPWINGDPTARGAVYRRFLRKGEYLVFLKRDRVGKRRAWTTVAALPVEYEPDAGGRIIGRISPALGSGLGIPVEQVQALLARVISGKRNAGSAAAALDRQFQAVITAQERQPREPSHAARLRDVRRLAVRVKPGTSRTDIARMFPEEDGGISGPHSTRYYLGSEVMVEVPFDERGGSWKSGNRVSGPLKVYRSMMHFD